MRCGCKAANVSTFCFELRPSAFASASAWLAQHPHPLRTSAGPAATLLMSFHEGSTLTLRQALKPLRSISTNSTHHRRSQSHSIFKHNVHTALSSTPIKANGLCKTAC